MNLILILRKYAITYFLIFFATATYSYELLPPGKIVGFSINECNEQVCYTISGPVGYSSKLGDIFSSEKTTVILKDIKSLKIQTFICDDFKLEVSDHIGTCSENNSLKFTEFNFLINKITFLKF